LAGNPRFFRIVARCRGSGDCELVGILDTVRVRTPMVAHHTRPGAGADAASVKAGAASPQPFRVARGLQDSYAEGAD